MGCALKTAADDAVFTGGARPRWMTVADGAIQPSARPRGVLLLCQCEATTGALAAILTQNNESALTVNSWVEAWECIMSGVVGCIVQDLTDPDTDALALFRAVRTTQATSTIPFLFLIKKDYTVIKFEGSGAQFVRDAWLMLPCSAPFFLASLRGLLDQQAALESSAYNSAVKVAASAAPSTESGPPSGDDGAILSGQLGTLDVTKILAMMEQLRLSGQLRVADGKRLGFVHFVNGAVRHAELNDIEGPDALFLLFHLKTGTFRFELKVTTDKRTIEGNTMALLLEGMRQMDEAKALVQAFHDRRAPAAGGAG
jgi:CheY-like chemotaxis protein